MTAAESRVLRASAGIASIRAAIASRTVTGNSPLVAELDNRSRELLEEEGITSGDLDEARDIDAVSGDGRELADERIGVLRRQRVEWDRRLCQQTATPCRPRVEQLGTRGGDKQHGRLAHVLRRDTRATRSRSLCAQWMSSKTNTVGCSRPAHSMKRRAA